MHIMNVCHVLIT